MKKIKLLFILLILKIYTLEVIAQQSKYLQTVFENKLITINSASNATLQGGKTREVIEFNIPNSSKSWMWSIKVVKRGSPLGTARKSLVQIASNYYTPGTGIIVGRLVNDLVDNSLDTYKNCDVYILSSEDDAQKFLQQGNWNFKYLKEWKDVGGNGDYVPDIKGKIYLGFINTNKTIGLDVYLDVLIENSSSQATGTFSNQNYTSPKTYLTGPYTDLGVAYAWFIDNQGNFYYGYVDSNGKTVLPFEFEQAFPFFNGEALVKKDGRFYYINRTGQKTRDYTSER